MIGTLLRIGWISLMRDRVVQALTFVLPILFFTIFALMLGNQRDKVSAVKVAVVDEDGSAYSKELVDALRAEGGLRVRTTTNGDGTGDALNRARAESLVRNGAVPIAIVLPKGLAEGRRFWRDTGVEPVKVQLLADVSDPVAPQMVGGLLQKVSFTAAPESMAAEGIAMFEKYSGPLTPAQRQSIDSWTKQMESARGPSAGGRPAGPATTGADSFGLGTEVVNVMEPGKGGTATISFYAAGIGVMFLLFSCAGAGGTLLEEEESGTLGRLVSSRAGMGGVLLGKWVFLAGMGVLQIVVMFTWGAVVFGLPLWSHLPGFFVMSVVTAAAAAAFGLLLATVSRSRAQLSGISTIVILTMSALGGSMFPRFLMSETMQTLGLGTFNAWALDGYLKVFWREAPLVALWPQVTVLAGLAVVFLLFARRMARRWETL
jgi:ABC-2 type transport system permease protein